MRLIDVETLEINTFSDQNVPAYAILSHTWGPDEVTFQDMCMITRLRSISQTFDSQETASSQSGDAFNSAMLAAMEMLLRGNWSVGMGMPDASEEALMRREGYRKIVCSAQEAKKLGYQWIWIDTCCIDKTSSAELQESINSMFKWYEESAICLVYLNDVASPLEETIDTQASAEVASNAFANCRWITRGWTLQELVAPTALQFYYQDWTLMGEKSAFVEELWNVTGIPIFALENGDLSELSIAERMSWACYRQTTRVEDMAYCLLGLFDIQMPLLYGEGEKAFLRLQQEILKTTDDTSLFAWHASTSSSKRVSPSKATYRGLLARSPHEFRNGGAISSDPVLCNFPTTSTPIGLHLELEFIADINDKTRFTALLRCTNALGQRLAIHLVCLDGGTQYARVQPAVLAAQDTWPAGQRRRIYVRQDLRIPHNFFASSMAHFHVRRGAGDGGAGAGVPLRVTKAWPPELWHAKTSRLEIPANIADFLGVLFLRSDSTSGSSTASATPPMTFELVLGLHRPLKHYFLKAVSCSTWPPQHAPAARWRAFIRRMLPGEVYDPLMRGSVRNDVHIGGEDGGGGGVGVCVKAGLWGDEVGLRVEIEGLIGGEGAFMGHRS